MSKLRRFAPPHLIVLLGLILCACHDPPNAGSLVIDVNQKAVRPDVSAMEFTLEQLVLFYDQAPATPPQQDVACNGGTVLAASQHINLTLSRTGELFVGAVNVPAGNLHELWLVVSGAQVTENGLVRPLHTSLNCLDGTSSDDDWGVIRLVSTDPGGITITKDQPTEISAAFDPNTDLTHFHGNDVNPPNPPPNGNGNPHVDGGAADVNGVLHGGRWVIAGSLPFVEVIEGNDSAIFPGQMLVRMDDGTSASDANSLAQSRGATVTGVIPEISLYRFQYPPGTDMQAETEDLNQEDGVKYALPNFVMRASQIPNDFNNQENLADVNAPATWDRITSTTAKVMVMDTGVDLENPDLVDNIFINPGEIPTSAIVNAGIPDRNNNGVADGLDLDLNGDGLVTFDELNDPANAGVCPKANHAPVDQCDPLDLVNGGLPAAGGGNYGWQDGVDNDNNGKVDDIVGWNGVGNNNLPMPAHGSDGSHGTSVAGLVGAVGNNGIGLSGTAWRVPIIPYRTAVDGFTFPDGGVGPTIGDPFAFTAGLAYAKKIDADVINLSFNFYLVDATEVTPQFPLLPACPDAKGAEVLPLIGLKFPQAYTVIDDFGRDVLGLAGDRVFVNSAGNCPFDMTVGGGRGVYDFPASSNVAGINAGSVSAPSNVLSSFSTFNLPNELFAPSEEADNNGFVPVLLVGPDNVGRENGTSLSAPIIAGAAALMIGNAPELKHNPCRTVTRLLSDAATIIQPDGRSLPLLDMNKSTSVPSPLEVLCP